MTFSTLKTRLKSLPCGKKLNHSVYIVEESLQIVDVELYKFIADLKTRVEAGSEYNIIKFFTNEFKISWLSYPDFFTDPHPCLKKSLTLNIATGKIRKFNYDKSLNPPILHQKETFLHPGHPQIETFSKLTKQEESYGLFENPRTIGFKLNWPIPFDSPATISPVCQNHFQKAYLELDDTFRIHSLQSFLLL